MSKRHRNPRGVYTITEKRVGGPFPYTTYTLRGTTRRGERIREQSTSKSELIGRRQALEIADANAPDERPISSHLTPEQVREAEAAVQRLSGRYSLSKAVDFFLAEYREPKTDKTLSEVVEIFLTQEIADREAKQTISPLVATNYRTDLRRFMVEHGKLKPHELSAYQITKWMESQTITKGRATERWGKKRWNNFRGLLNPFFKWMMAEPRRWLAANPVDPVRRYSKKDLDAPEPEILSVEQCIDVLQLAMVYKEGAMVPYFALAMFAGLRPSTREGELVKLGAMPNVAELINLEKRHIRVPKQIAKGRFVRGIDIQPNLAQWLTAYPLSKHPIVPTNHESMVEFVRTKIGLGHDVLRHTFISMHVERFQSVGGTARQAGNSEQMIRDHYLNLVSKEDCDWFWSLTPQSIRPVGARLSDLLAACRGDVLVPYVAEETSEA